MLEKLNLYLARRSCRADGIFGGLLQRATRPVLYTLGVNRAAWASITCNSGSPCPLVCTMETSECNAGTGFCYINYYSCPSGSCTRQINRACD